jgi:uncharacterized protein YjbI with pentapeptide repeats
VFQEKINMTKVKQVYLTKEELFNFIQKLKLHRERYDTALSLTDFIKDERELINTDNIIYQANISNINLDEREVADLRGSDLSFVNFGDKDKNKIYNKQWVISGLYGKDNHLFRPTNLQGASFLAGCTFDGVSFRGADLGKRTITSDQFKRCNFKDSLFDPSNPQLMIVKVGEKELKNYIKLRYKHPVHVSAMGSFSDYISYTKRHLLSDGIKVVADLSDQVIDGNNINLDGIDLSGALLENTTLKNVRVESLIMRDCGVVQIKFDDCKINRLDIRGSNIDQYLGTNYINSMEFIGKTSFDEVRLSSSSVYKSFPCTTPIFDPCYIKGKSSFKIVDDRIVAQVPDLGRYRKCTIEDIKEYAKECQESEAVLSSSIFSSHGIKDQLQSFRNFLIKKHNLEGDFIPDMSGLVLDKLNLSYGNWGKCDWSRCSMVETRWDYSNLEYSNFSNSSFEGNIPGWGMGWFERKYSTSFKGTLLTGGIFDNASGKCAIFTEAEMNGVFAIGANFREAVFDKSQAKNSNFSYAHMELVKAKGMDASNSIMRDVLFIYGDAPKAKLNYSTLDGTVFNYTNLRGAEVKYASAVGSSFSDVDATNADFTGTKLWANVSRMKLKGAKLDHVENSEWEIEPGVFWGLFGDSEPHIDERTKCEKMVDSTNALDMQEKSARVKQDVKRMGSSKWRWGVFTAAKTIDKILGGNLFKSLASTIFDLADHKWITGACVVVAPIALMLVAKFAMTHLTGTTIATMLLSMTALPTVSIAAATGVAAAIWFTGAGSDSKEVKGMQARKVEFQRLHPNSIVYSPEIMPEIEINVESSKVLHRKVTTEKAGGHFVDHVENGSHNSVKKVHGKYTEALAREAKAGTDVSVKKPG